MTIAARTNRGKIREINEDSLLARDGLLIVADGMGGHRGGEIASRIAVEETIKVLDSRESCTADDIEEAMQTANRRVFETAQGDESLGGMGTTMTLCYMKDNFAMIAHVGDSRAYLMRNGKLIRLTRDHSLVEELVRNGYISREQAANHPHRHVITRALGSEGPLRVDRKIVATQKGDLLLLCTDGVMLYIADDEIESILQGGGEPESHARALESLALERGGEDNISIILARVEGGNPQ